MLYASRNMVPEKLRKDFVVDYGMSVDELYGEFYKEVERTCKEEMSFVEGSEREKSEQDIASTVQRYRSGW